jgi:predicted GIY-YIG superfamily endonuclease
MNDVDIPETSGTYLIHFHTPYGKRKVQHYHGWASNIRERIQAHRMNVGAKLVRAVNKAGIEWEVAKVWEGEVQEDERDRKKRKKSFARICPICNKGDEE